METDSNSDNELMPTAAQMPPYNRANIEMLIRRHQAAVTALGLAFNGPQHCRPVASVLQATSVAAPKHHTIDAILGLKRDDQPKDSESGGKYNIISHEYKCVINVLSTQSQFGSTLVGEGM